MRSKYRNGRRLTEAQFADRAEELTKISAERPGEYDAALRTRPTSSRANAMRARSRWRRRLVPPSIARTSALRMATRGK